MTLKSPVMLVIVSLFVACAGCDSGGGLDNPNQPKDLGAPWVNKTDSDWGFSSSSSDPAGNRVFSCTKSDFHGLIEDIAAEYNAPIAVKPKEMLDWNLTVEVKGKNQEQVLQDVAAQCRLSLGKSSGGLPLLTFPGKESSPEFVVKPEAEDGEESSEP